MKAAILLFGAAIALGACSGQEQAADEANETAVPADIETLPADESVATPSDDLADGTTDVPAEADAADAADANALDANAAP